MSNGKVNNDKNMEFWGKTLNNHFKLTSFSNILSLNLNKTIFFQPSGLPSQTLVLQLLLPEKSCKLLLIHLNELIIFLSFITSVSKCFKNILGL